MSEVHEQLWEMLRENVAAGVEKPEWRMTPIAFAKVQMAEKHTGEMLTIVANRPPICLGHVVRITQPSVYRASEIALGDGPMVKL